MYDIKSVLSVNTKIDLIGNVTEINDFCCALEGSGGWDQTVGSSRHLLFLSLEAVGLDVRVVSLERVLRYFKMLNKVALFIAFASMWFAGGKISAFHIHNIFKSKV